MSKTLYIIHGWAYSIEPWDKTVAALKARGINVVQLRVPGLTTPSERVWTIDDYVMWLGGQLENDPAPIVLGHSNGGRIAMHYLQKFPQRFKHLILLSSAGIEIDAPKLSRKRRVFRALSKTLAPLKHIPGVRKIVYRLLGSDYGRAPKNMQATLTNMLASDREFDPSFITTPTSILWGADDRTTPLGMGEKLHGLIRGSSFKSLPQWQHAPYRTHPQQLADEIYAILEQLS